jgi:amidase
MSTPPFDRRAFLRLGALGGAAAAWPEALNGHDAQEDPARHGDQAPRFELDELTIAELQHRMASGRETARSITERYLSRIAALDRQGPALRQVLETNPDALAIADQRDAERKAGKLRGPLHGIPVLLKDNIGTADRMTTTAGSLALDGSIPAKDAFVAARLREAGAILLGKTNMSEWANIRSMHSTSGWSGRAGLGRNPYALDRNTSGSSSGSAAATAASYAAAAIGTETDGSIVSPSNCCGLVGLKPTLGLVSRTGVIPIAHSQDTAGPMTRTVADAAALLTALAGTDPADPETSAAARHATDYTQYLDAAGLKGARIGVPRGTLFGRSMHADRLADAALDTMKAQGAIVIDPVSLEMPGDLWESELEVLLYELKADLNAWLATLGAAATVKTLADVIAFNEAHRDREMPYFGQDLFLKAQEKGPLTTPAYRRALRRNRDLTRRLGIDAVMRKHRLDALVAPTGAPAWLTDLVNGDCSAGGASSVPAIAGYPHITVPAGFVNGLPAGVSFFGHAWSEPVLIRLAYAFEQATKHRRPPKFLATAEIDRAG